jgi:hypothetical protein
MSPVISSGTFTARTIRRCAIELSVSPITMAVTAAMAQTVYMQENDARKPKYSAIMIHLGES